MIWWLCTYLFSLCFWVRNSLLFKYKKHGVVAMYLSYHGTHILIMTTYALYYQLVKQNRW